MSIAHISYIIALWATSTVNSTPSNVFLALVLVIHCPCICNSSTSASSTSARSTGAGSTGARNTKARSTSAVSTGARCNMLPAVALAKAYKLGEASLDRVFGGRSRLFV